MADVIAREVFGLLFETSTEPVFIVNLATQRIVSANVRAAELFALELDALVGRTLGEVAVEADRDLTQPGHYEDVALRRGDGYDVYAELNVVHVAVHDRGQLAAYTARDTSERRLLERELVAKHSALFTAYADLARAHAQLSETKRDSRTATARSRCSRGGRRWASWSPASHITSTIRSARSRARCAGSGRSSRASPTSHVPSFERLLARIGEIARRIRDQRRGDRARVEVECRRREPPRSAARAGHGVVDVRRPARRDPHEGTVMKPARILVVDDDDHVREALVDELSPTYTVEAVSSGCEAFDAISLQQYDVIISDLKMPDHDGIEVLEFARQHQRDAVRVLLTGYLDERAHRALLSPDAPYKVGKPSHDEIEVVVARALEQRELARRLCASVEDALRLTTFDQELEATRTPLELSEIIVRRALMIEGVTACATVVRSEGTGIPFHRRRGREDRPGMVPGPAARLRRRPANAGARRDRQHSSRLLHGTSRAAPCRMMESRVSLESTVGRGTRMNQLMRQATLGALTSALLHDLASTMQALDRPRSTRSRRSRTRRCRARRRGRRGTPPPATKWFSCSCRCASSSATARCRPDRCGSSS